LLADTSRTGVEWCRAYSDLVDRWLADLLAAAGGEGGRGGCVALVAVGGYGRRELCPESDIDVMLLHDRKANPAEVARIADRIWYPIWDQGFHLGHSVCTVRQALTLAGDAMETATALLSSRHVAGDPSLCAPLIEGAQQNWQKRASRVLTELASSVEARHQHSGDAAFRLEPDLKEARGGLRDVHALSWAKAAHTILLDYDTESLAKAYAVLLDARVELQRRTSRPGNVLLLQEQDGVAQALGLPDADHLMAEVADAARRIAWTSDDTWRRVTSTLRGPVARGGQRARDLGAGVLLADGEVTFGPDAVVAEDQTLALRVAVAAAQHASPIDRRALERLAVGAPALSDPWPPAAAALFVALLAAGRPAVAVVEALDHYGIWAQILPEWRAVRSRPQHNAFHRFTVDRHLLETAANAAGLVDRVNRPDLLVLAAFLHDMGKGQPGDHSTVGASLARGIATRMGLAADDVDTLECLVVNHLLLADVASRRDLDDPVTIRRAAEELLTAERVRLLGALTEADSLATGPSAWSPWKAGLVATLVDRVVEALDGPGAAPDTTAGPAAGATAGATAGAAPAAAMGPPGAGPRPFASTSAFSATAAAPLASGTGSFPSDAALARLADGGRHIEFRGSLLTVMTDDRPGVFSRVAGVLALHGLDVVAASAYSSDDGRALAEFRVTDAVRDAIPWPRVIAALELALEGRLALAARLAERRRTYDRPPFSRRFLTARVSFDNAASGTATVIDVYAMDRTGLLYAITRALAELDLDIHSARIQTMGPEVVDAFYVRGGDGAKVTDPATLGEIERAILFALGD
jgi:[protein-PII] uridylyltransferase